LLFYAHGTSIWVPAGGTGLPAGHWMFKSDPWSLENYYFMQWEGVGAGSRLADSAGAPAVDTVTAAPHFLRAERDLESGSCDASGAFDAGAGMYRYWYGRLAGAGTGGPVTWTASQLRSPSWTALPERASDSAWLGFFVFGGSNANIFTANSGPDSV